MKCFIKNEVLYPSQTAEGRAEAPKANPNAWSPRITHHAPGPPPHVSRITFHVSRAFSLVEVMVACGIFFLAIFTILALVSSTLRNARGLRRRDVDAGMVAAGLFKTNKLYEGSESGDFGDLYPDYSWETETYEAATNGLWEVDITVHRRGTPQPVDNMSVWIFSPDSSTGPFGGNRFGGPR
jgi:hypothetical protein